MTHGLGPIEVKREHACDASYQTGYVCLELAKVAMQVRFKGCAGWSVPWRFCAACERVEREMLEKRGHAVRTVAL